MTLATTITELREKLAKGDKGLGPDGKADKASDHLPWSLWQDTAHPEMDGQHWGIASPNPEWPIGSPGNDGTGGIYGANDAALIVAAVNNLPTLLTALEASQAENERLREALEEILGVYDSVDRGDPGSVAGIVRRETIEKARATLSNQKRTT